MIFLYFPAKALKPCLVTPEGINRHPTSIPWLLLLSLLLLLLIIVIIVIVVFICIPWLLLFHNHYYPVIQLLAYYYYCYYHYPILFIIMIILIVFIIIYFFYYYYCIYIYTYSTVYINNNHNPMNIQWISHEILHLHPDFAVEPGLVAASKRCGLRAPGRRLRSGAATVGRLAKHR